MRNEAQMMELILSTAREDERIRAVILNGSRANPEARRDLFQDYDIVYIVASVEAIISDRAWFDRFGERMIAQSSDEQLDSERRPGDGYICMMQFMDGNRLDLRLFQADRLAELASDSLSVLLLDKDGLIGEMEPPSLRDYAAKRPTSREFAACANEFWWVSTYVAKGLWRDELTYAKSMMDGPVREMLIRMLAWQIGERSGYTADTGKLGKYLKSYMAPAEWKLFVRTYPDADPERMWDALLRMGELFRHAGREVAAACGHAYPEEDDRRVTAHLAHVRRLAPDASDYMNRDGHGRI
ncbi:aminoglycoside 6-adenylyltransferase [Paenibacillus methanolicus]|uniref:Aminoglycoside 6-adenylyltransferase n=1 Tax=Paenibacillus methanolicus TaxID=582686 RepID=A0A5S5BRM3_9BACL|nr:aminoglycoside 6-adenylyltransferase [Paenibacillus methanolicus]TYP69729.1 aminoglycoside 6-adenylyltransferase [Paenibacillus methanolicus]